MSGNKFGECRDGVERQSPLKVRFGSVHCVLDPDIAELINDSAFENVAATDSFTSGYVWNGREQEADIEMQYNRARCVDPNPGRFLYQD